MNPTRTILVTGGSSGLGLETVKLLAQSAENHVIIASRKPADAVAALNLPNVDGMPLNLGSLAAVCDFVQRYKQRDLPPLYAIVCNAGVTLMGKTRYSAENHEFTFAVNHLGHFLLVNELLPLLTRPGRIIITSSGTHIPEHKLARRTGVPKPRYTSAMALAEGDRAPADQRLTNQSQRYSTSKLCNVLFGYELARRIDDDQIGIFMFDPGLMPDTNLANEYPAPVAKLFMGGIKLIAPFIDGIRMSTVSAQHMAWLVTDQTLTGKTALYFDGDKEVRSSADSYDQVKARDLWVTSEQLIAMPTPSV